MNQFSQEIKEDLKKMASKYQINKGIFMFEETNIETGNIKNRVIFFNPVSDDFSIHDFSDLFYACMDESKSMQSLIEHFNMHSLEDLIQAKGFKLSGKKAN